MMQSRRDLNVDTGASLVEYSLALVLIGLVAALAAGSLGRATSGAFDQVGNAFPTDAVAVSPLADVTSDAFDELLERIAGVGSEGDSLAGKAENAQKAYLRGDIDGSIEELNSVITDVDVQQGKQLSYDDAAWVRNAARRLVETVRSG